MKQEQFLEDVTEPKDLGLIWCFDMRSNGLMRFNIDRMCRLTIIERLKIEFGNFETLEDFNKLVMAKRKW